MRYFYLIAFALLTIYTLIGLLPEAQAKDCFQRSDGRVVCCTVVAGFPYCN